MIHDVLIKNLRRGDMLQYRSYVGIIIDVETCFSSTNVKIVFVDSVDCFIYHPSQSENVRVRVHRYLNSKNLPGYEEKTNVHC